MLLLYRIFQPKLKIFCETCAAKIENDEPISPDDLQLLLDLFQENAKRIKEKYGIFCNNYPISQYIVSQVSDYFNVSSQKVILKVTSYS